MTQTALHTDLAWLVRLRWVAIAGQLVTLVVARALGAGELERVGWLLGLVALGALSNVLLARWPRGPEQVGERVIASVMALDFGLLTALLAGSGGASNPFSVLYVVHVALAAMLLRRALVWLLASLSALCFASLFFVDGGPHAHHVHDMTMHYRGMWIAFVMAAAILAYFVDRIRRSLESQRALADAERARAARSERLASLATLAAGAAHELATPLSTIAVVAKELERQLATTQPRHAEDAKLIREEVARCRGILEQLAADAGTTMGEPFVRTTLEALVAQALRHLPEAERVTLDVDPALDIEVPVRTLARALRGIAKNALEASRGHAVALHAHARVDGSVEIRVDDRGDGMAEHVQSRIGEPFFTTKEQGRGMGLGVFLARSVVGRLGGELRYESTPGRGTTATLWFPRTPHEHGAGT